MGVKGFKEGTAGADAYAKAKEYMESVGAYIIYKALPYPISAFFFLHWQIGVSAFAFSVVPGVLSLWALYHAMGNRNYFATNPPAYKNQRIADGPLFNENSSDDESASESSSDYESDDRDSEVQPLSKRHNDSVTASKPSTNSGKETRGKVIPGRRGV